ncbi:N-acetylglucosamine kinase [Thalassoglobus sp.]|uniref:N-acetylglucosamine kinase n=1 Tax=Thalassoglobus sp. TaxID=2795869 RepID=UPI003AA985E5
MNEPQESDRSPTIGELVIGVDAGGTKTTAWLADSEFQRTRQPIGKGHAGPGNPRAVGFDAACQQIQTAIEDAFLDAQLPKKSVFTLCLCAAGAGRVEEQVRLEAWANGLDLATNVIVTDDAQPILAAASPERIGIALISGTGSFAWGRNADGDIARSGGWGYLFGDEGSGYQIALAGLQAATKAADDRGPRTRLLSAFLDHFQIAEASELIGKIYGDKLSREVIAGLSSIVFSLSDDEVAHSIIDEAANELATMVESLAAKLGLNLCAAQLALAGGVFVHQPAFVEKLQRRLALSEQFMTIVKEPVAGAVAIALNEKNSEQ